MTDRQAAGVSTEVVVQPGLRWRQAGGMAVEVIIANAAVDYGVVAVGYPTTGIVMKMPDGSWKQLRAVVKG